MKKKIAGIGLGIAAVFGGLYALLFKTHEPAKPTPAPVVTVATPSPALVEPDDPTTNQLDQPRQVGSKTFKASSLSTINASETQPECNSVLIETRYRKIVGSVDANGIEHDAKYDGDWAFPPDQLPTNTPCWKDWFQTAYYSGKEIAFETSASVPPTPRYGGNVVVWRLYFDKPTPTPTPTPMPTPTPIPYCASGQRPGNPPKCKCRNGYLGNSGKCR